MLSDNIMEDNIVCKFGGTSMADGKSINQVKQIINDDYRRKYIVVSAPGKRNSKDVKVTDLLYQCHSLMKKGVSVKECFSPIRSRFESIAKELDLDFNIESVLNETEKRIKDEMDEQFTISRGEYLSARIFAEYIGVKFIDAENVMVFNSDNTFNLSESCKEIFKALHGVKRAVIPGFYGATLEGKINTFTRGGSDISGAVVACAVDSLYYENWTDVSGFLACDPRIVNQPTKIKHVTYKELHELSCMGANVLHSDSILPVRIKKIPIVIRNTFQPSDEGTLITSESFQNDHFITGVAGKKNYIFFSIEKNNFDNRLYDVINNIFQKENVPIEYTYKERNSYDLFIENSRLNDDVLQSLFEDIQREISPDFLECNKNVSIIAIVGEGISKDRFFLDRINETFCTSNINFKILDKNLMNFKVVISVNDEDYNRSINSIYTNFFL
ncbi:hypothetical protein M9Y10_037748 [Tritrichomonas musculus]|uniref:Aspartokinase n=1 Tax=Tritrichomonas musculus TaxID=1915356 RepID=A0ABR2GRC3_9EUKA